VAFDGINDEDLARPFCYAEYQGYRFPTFRSNLPPFTFKVQSPRRIPNSSNNSKHKDEGGVLIRNVWNQLTLFE